MKRKNKFYTLIRSSLTVFFSLFLRFEIDYELSNLATISSAKQIAMAMNVSTWII